MKSKTTPTSREALHALLHELNFEGMARVLDAELERAERLATPAAEVVQRLLAEQASFQRERSLANRVAKARLPWQWTLESFPFAQQPGVNKAQIMGLGGLDFLRRAQNLVLIGGPDHAT
jgi:DNA replication protein DnaC